MAHISASFSYFISCNRFSIPWYHDRFQAILSISDTGFAVKHSEDNGTTTVLGLTTWWAVILTGRWYLKKKKKSVWFVWFFLKLNALLDPAFKFANHVFETLFLKIKTWRKNSMFKNADNFEFDIKSFPSFSHLHTSARTANGNKQS